MIVFSAVSGNANERGVDGIIDMTGKPDSIYENSVVWNAILPKI